MHQQLHALESECGCSAAMVRNEIPALLGETLMQHAQIIDAGPTVRLNVLALRLVARCERMAFMFTLAFLRRSDFHPRCLYRYYTNTPRVTPRPPYATDDHTELPIPNITCNNPLL